MGTNKFFNILFLLVFGLTTVTMAQTPDPIPAVTKPEGTSNEWTFSMPNYDVEVVPLQPYAEVSADEETGAVVLTFKYGEKPESDFCYSLNEGTMSPAWSSLNSGVTKVVFEDIITPTTCAFWFYGMKYLTSIENLENLHTENVTDMTFMFADCSGLTTLDVSKFNTEKVENMSGMFYGCSGLTTLDVSNFNTGKVENMSLMFYNCSSLTTLDLTNFSTTNVKGMENMFNECSSLTTILVGSGWNTENVVYDAVNNEGGSEDMFYNCTFLIGNDGSTVGETVDKTYAHAGEGGYLTTSDYKIFYQWADDVSDAYHQVYTPSTYNNSTTPLTIDNPTREGYKFLYWTQVSASGTLIGESSENLTIAAGETGNRIYKMHWAINQYDVEFETEYGEKPETQTVTYGEKVTEPTAPTVASHEFQYWQTADNIEWIFDNTVSSSLTLTAVWQPKNFVANFYYNETSFISSVSVVYGSTLTPIATPTKPNHKFLHWALTDGGEKVEFDEFTMPAEDVNFYAQWKAFEPYAVISDNTTDGGKTLTFKYDADKPETGAYGLNEGTYLPAWSVERGNITNVVFKESFKDARPTTCYSWFTSMGNLKEIEGIQYLNTSAVTNMYSMFLNCSGLTTLDVSSFNTEQVTDMEYMFLGCSGLTTLNLSNFSTGSVTDMKYMFDGCSGLTTLDVSSFSTGSVTDMSYMFHDCSGLTTLDVSSFSTGSVTDMSYMFYDCSGLTTLDVSSFNTEQVVNMSRMFYNCNNLTTLDVSNFSTGQVANMYSMFYGCSGLTTLDLSSFSTGSVMKMSYMFKGCSGLTTILIDENKWNTTNVTQSEKMFENCKVLVGNDGTIVGSVIDKTNAHAHAGGYLTTGDYKIFYKWADEDGYKTQYTPSTYNSSITPLTIDNPNDREGYKFLYWTRVSASGEQIDGSSANLTIAAGDIGNRIYQMHWTVDVTAIADTRFRGKPTGNLDEIHICGSEFQMSANETTISGVEGRWTLDDGSSVENFIATTDIHNPSATVRNIPNTGVTLRWTITDGTNSGSDEITIYNEKAETSVTVPEYSCDGTVTLSADISSSDYTCRWSTEADGTFSSNTAEIVKTKEGASVTFSGMTVGVTTTFIWNLVHKVSVTDGERTYDECASDDQIVYVTNHQIEAKISYPDKKNKLICVDNFDGLLANDVSLYDDGTNTIKGWWTSDNDAFIKYEARYEGISNSAYAVDVSDLPHGETVFTWHVEGFGCGEVTETVTINNGAVTADAGEDDFTCTDEYELHASELEEEWTGYWLIIGGSFEKYENSTNNVTKVTGLSEYIANTFQWHVKTADYYGQEGCSDYDDVTIKANGFTVYANETTPIDNEKNSQYSLCGSEGSIMGTIVSGGTGYWTSSPAGLIVGASTDYELDFDLGTNKSAVFTWTVTNGSCTDFDEVTVTNIKPKAETEKLVYYACGDGAVTLSGKLPENTTGEWSKSSSIYEGAFVGATDIINAKYSFTSNGSMESAELEWTVKSIEDPYCYTSTTVTVKNNHVEPTITASNYVCGTETSIEGSIPESGFNGYWICTSSALVTFDESTNKQSTVKNLQPGENTIQWTVFNAEGERCNSVSEEYVINNIKVDPTVSDVDPTFDGTFSVNLSAGSLSDFGTVGSDIFGRWETVSAPISVNILNSTNNETEVSGLTETGDYEFKWVVYRKIDGFPEETGYSDGGFCHDSKTVSFKYEVMKLLVDASGFEYGLPVYPKVTTIQGLDVTEDCEKLYTDENGQPVLTDLSLTPVGKYTLKASYLGVTSSTTFNISPRHVTPEITLSQTEVVYDGGEKTPEIISVAFDGIDLLDECGEPLYQNNRNVGMATVTITNKSGSNYTFSKSVNFFINAIPFEYLVGKRAVVKIPVSTTGLNFSSDNKDISVVFRDGGYCVTTSKNVKKGDIAHIKSTIVDIVVTVADPFENFFDDSKWYNTDIALKTPENSNGWILSLPDYTDNTVTQEGENNVKCQILDDEENIIAEESYLIKIDKTAPEISVLADGHGLENSKHYFLRSGAEFSAVAKDNFSGVETLEYSWDNEIFKQYDEKITLPYGKSSVYVRSKDVAGNQTETLKADFSVFEDSKFALNNSDEITSDTIFYSSKNISDMSFEVDLNGNTIGSVTDASGNSFNFSDNVITVKKEYLETLSPGISPLYVRINPLGEKSAWDGGNPADFESETMTINLDVKYIVTIDKRYDFALLTDPDVKIFCPGDNVVMSFDFDEDCSSADFITVKLLGIEKETPDGGINFQVPFDGLRGGKESLAIEFYKDGYVFEDSVVFSANYPSERTFRVYDDVLALDNFDRQFVDSCYKWYIDNKEIDSANAQFLDLTKVIFDNEQHVFTVSVLDKDGNRFRVCPDEDFVVTPSVSKRQASKVKTYPNPAVSRQPVYIELKNFAEEDFSETEILIYNQLGGLVQKVSEVGERTAVVLPSGFYSGVVVVRGQRVLNFKIVVE